MQFFFYCKCFSYFYRIYSFRKNNTSFTPICCFYWIFKVFLRSLTIVSISLAFLSKSIECTLSEIFNFIHFLFS